MTEIILSTIIDFSRDYSRGQEFETLFCEYQKILKPTGKTDLDTVELKKVYVQFQYGIASTPSATKGIKVDRYSKKGQYISATIEVAPEGFDSLAIIMKKTLLGCLLVKALGLIKTKLQGNVSNELAALIEEVNSANLNFVGQPSPC